MKPTRSTNLAIGMVLLVGAALLSAGCAEELGPVQMPVARVRGVVREGDRPLSGGWIEFVPVEGTIGNLRSARLRPDGTFDADGVAVGQNLIRLVNAPIESPIYRQLFTPTYSQIRRVIPAHPSAPLNINLVEEAVRYEQTRGQRMVIAPPAAGEGP